MAAAGINKSSGQDVKHGGNTMDYEKQAIDFLTASGLEFRAVLVGDDCPPFCEDAIADRDMDKINVFPRKTHIHGKHYRCTISGKERGHVSFDFWNSYRDSEENAFNYGIVRGNCGHGPDCLCETKAIGEGILLGQRDNVYWGKYRGGKHRGYSVLRPLGKRKTIQPYDLLACIQKNDVGTFADFCGDFGYDEDSRRAEQTYIAVCKEFQKVQKFFTAAELEALQDIS
jgi:hypothetical protein